MSSESRLVVIATFDSAAEAEAIRLLLDSHGIEAHLHDQHMASNYVIAVGGAKVLVPEADVKAASLIIAEHREKKQSRRGSDDSSGTIMFPCEECGMTLSFPAHRAGGVERCSHCGKYVDVPE